MSLKFNNIGIKFRLFCFGSEWWQHIVWLHHSLQLIEYGCSISMRLPANNGWLWLSGTLRRYVRWEAFAYEAGFEVRRKSQPFVVFVHIKPWFGTTDAAVAPRTDSYILKKFRRYFNSEMEQTVARKLENHLWYLPYHFLRLALFDHKVLAEMVTDPGKKFHSRPCAHVLGYIR